MVVIYSLNSNVITGGIQAHWPPIQTGNNGDGGPQYNAIMYRHTWTIPELELADYDILQAARGTSFTELKTTAQATPNSQGTYTTGRVMTVTGQHRARQMLNVKVDFLVDIT